MPSNIVLYRKDGACSFIPHALLNELGIPYQSVVLDLKDGAMQAADGSLSNEEYRKIHPSAYVPALQVDGQIITELPAVLTYISDLAPERKLFGSTPMEKAKVYEWLAWLSGTLHAQGYGALWRPKRFTDDDAENVHKAITEKGRSNIMAVYTRIEHRIEGPHAVGGEFTVVDLGLHTFWRWGALRIGIDQNDFAKQFPKYTALVKGVEKMDSVQKTLQEENLPPAF